MIVYEVRASVDDAVAAAYREWLAPHVTEILAIPGFAPARWKPTCATTHRACAPTASRASAPVFPPPGESAN